MRHNQHVFDARGKIRLAFKHLQTVDEYAADLRALMKPDAKSAI